jgi:hypothetical protein
MAYEARTQLYTIQIRHCSPDRGLYLRWQTNRGNWEGWLFDGQQDTKYSVDNPTSYSPADVANLVALARPGQVLVTIRTGNLSQAQLQGLASLLTSTMVFIQDSQGNLTPVMVAENATASSSTSDGKQVLALDILPPPPNSLVN